MPLPAVWDGPERAEQETRAHGALASTSNHRGVAAAASSLGPPPFFLAQEAPQSREYERESSVAASGGVGLVKGPHHKQGHHLQNNSLWRVT